jgi:hypothetical protein
VPLKQGYSNIAELIKYYQEAEKAKEKKKDGQH